MIDKALNFTLDELNSFLGTRFQSQENLAVLSSLSSQDGSAPVVTDNKIVMSLVNIERETAASSAVRTRADGGSYIVANPALNLNLYILVSACFGHSYAESLKFLANALAFFQSKPVFTPKSSAGFPRELEQISFEMVNLSFQELNNMWGIMGAKYIPSVLYKLRMLTIDEAWVALQVEPIRSTKTSTAAG
jgi:hypothetical protein